MGGAGVTTAGPLNLTLQARPASPGEARTAVKLRLAEWELSEVSDDVVLIASELVTNAAQYGAGAEIRVRLMYETGAVVLAVWDSSDAKPVRKRPLEATAADTGPDAEALDAGHDAATGGRGLPIVAAMSEECGVTPTEPGGKWVWARYATTTGPSARVLSRR